MKKIIPNQNLLYRLKNAEHFDLMESIHDEVKQVKDTIPGITAVWENFHTAFLKEDEFYKLSLKMENTSEVKAADDKRDATYLELKREIEYKQYSKVEEEKEAADKLKFLFDNYKHANTAAYTENSAMLTNLIQDLKAPAYAPYVSKLNLTALIDRLEEENNAFKAIYRERSKETYQHQQESLSNLKITTDRAFFSMADALNAIYLTNELKEKDAVVRQTLGALIDDINSFLVQSEKVYARRVPSYKTVKGGEGGSGEGTNPPLPPELPFFTMKNPVVSGDDHPNLEGSGSKWSIEADDPEGLAAALSPGLSGCVVRFPSEQSVGDFPIDSFLTDDNDNTIKGIVMGQAKDGENWYIKPFDGIDLGTPQIFRDNTAIAVLDGVLYPQNISIS